MRCMNRVVSWTAALSVVAALASGCGSGVPTASTPVTTATTATSTSAPTTTATTSAPAVLSPSSRLRIDGLGPIAVGMTVAEARAAAGVELSLKKEPYCDVLTAPGGPAGVALIITAPPTGRVQLIIVNGGAVATLSGIRVGSTEAEVLATYPGRLRAVNASLPVHRLIYEALDPALADRVLAFTIDNGRVATMYAGVRNQAEADEICG